MWGGLWGCACEGHRSMGRENGQHMTGDKADG